MGNKAEKGRKADREPGEDETESENQLYGERWVEVLKQYLHFISKKQARA